MSAERGADALWHPRLVSWRIMRALFGHRHFFRSFSLLQNETLEMLMRVLAHIIVREEQSSLRSPDAALRAG